MPAEPNDVDVAVIGVGHMGTAHARVYGAVEGANLVAVVDRDAERAATVADQYRCDAFTDVAQLLDKHPGLQAASVAVPTAAHRAAATPLLCRRIACLVEKPLAASVSEARALGAVAAEHGSILQVGHTERFNPAVQAIAAMSLKPRFVEVHRVSPMAFRSLDIGVVMDMMIHDLDIVLMLADSKVRRVDATGIAVLGEGEDVANARLVFECGCVANLTSSRLALKTERKMRVFSEHAYVSLDYQKRSGVIIRKSDNDAALRQVREQVASGADLSDLDYEKLVQVEQLQMDGDGDGHDPLTAQLTSFIQAVQQKRPPVVDAQAGYAAVEVAQRVIDAIGEHRWEGLADVRL